jgi:acyl-CoA reductase-like NAD-dependent aldehyde dehydrogenase
LEIVRRFRYRLVSGALEMAAVVPPKSPAGAVEKLAAEVVPVADACHFLERRAPALLAPKKFGGSGRPVWLFGVKAEVRREPLGVVLIIGPGNYPLLLTGVQILQGLVAGNAVVVKPAEGCTKAGGPLEYLAGIAASRTTLLRGRDRQGRGDRFSAHGSRHSRSTGASSYARDDGVVGM